MLTFYIIVALIMFALGAVAAFRNFNGDAMLMCFHIIVSAAMAVIWPLTITMMLVGGVYYKVLKRDEG